MHIWDGNGPMIILLGTVCKTLAYDSQLSRSVGFFFIRTFGRKFDFRVLTNEIQI